MLFELPEFEYFEPTTLEEALKLLGEYGNNAKILAGGTDLLGLMKDRIQGKSMPIPSALVNIKKIEGLRKISHFDNESVIGSAVKLTEIHSDEVLTKRFPALVQAARSVATNQIRNIGTLGGNLCQRPWCWYFRHPSYDCFKKGGRQCYAITGDNSTYFSVYNIGTCVMAHPSDTAPALIALDARTRIAGVNGLKEVRISDFFLGPKSVQDNILSSNEILVDVSIPKLEPNERTVYLKYRIRNNWDFALASVAARGSKDGNGSIHSFKLVLGGVAPLPLRLRDVETMFLGRKYAETTRMELLRLVTNQAKPLKMNRYKLRIVRALVSRAVEEIFGVN